VILGHYGLLTHSTGVIGHGQANLADQVNAGVWAAATLLWTGTALAGALLAARRHQER
jgi:phosphate/sulfate permease